MSTNGSESFWNLIPELEKKGGILIPEIQRDYVQGRNTPKATFVREKLLEDIINGLREYKNTKKTVDLNFVYGMNNKDYFIPLDGQQRLTALFCLHIYLFARCNDSDNYERLIAAFKYKVRESTARFITNIKLKEYFLLTDEEKKAASYGNIGDYIKDADWYQTPWEYDPSIRSMITVFNTIETMLPHGYDELVSMKGLLISDNCPIRFLVLKLQNIASENDLYIKMNSRGRALTQFECFKSSLFDDINEDAMGVKDFKINTDREWAEFIFNVSAEYCAKLSLDKRLTPDIADNGMMLLFHYIMLNSFFAAGLDAKTIVPLYENDGFYNYTHYTELADSKSVPFKNAVCDIYRTFKLFTDPRLNFACDDELLLKLAAGRLDLDERAILFILTRYASIVDEKDWSKTTLDRWRRVMTNLIANIEFNEKNFPTFINRAQALGSQYALDTYSQITANRDYFIELFGKTYQANEEALKCALMNAEPAWEPLLQKAEQLNYFNRSIRFMLQLLDIDETALKTDVVTLNKFDSNLSKISLLFDDYGLKNGQAVLFRRVLLCYGDYSYECHADDGNGKIVAFYRENNWRKARHADADFCWMLCESKGISTFKPMFFEWDASGKTFIDFAQDKVKAWLSAYSGDKDDLQYRLIKHPALFEYINNYGHYVDYCGDIYLLSGKNRNRGIHYKLLSLKEVLGEGNITEFAVKGDYKSNSLQISDNIFIRYDKEFSINGKVVEDGNGNPIKGIDEINVEIKKLFNI